MKGKTAYLAGATRRQVMKKHRPKAVKIIRKPPRRDVKREQAALSEWEYLNRN